jgi:uncharacterized Zn-binding protein involved in type VI secretion
MHNCPAFTGVVPHVGGPITAPGCPIVLIGNLPAARVGDMATCTGPPDAIIQGETSVLIGNQPAARLGDMTSHGGVITTGCMTVLIGVPAAGACLAEAAKTGAPFVSNVAPPVDNEPVGDLPVSENPDGSIQVGQSITVKGDETFKKKTLAALRKMGETETGKKVLNSIESSGKTVTVVETKDGNSEDAENFTDGLRKRDGTPGKGSDATVKFNPDRKVVGDGSQDWMTRSPAVGLSHEMIHAARDTNGTSDYDYSDRKKSPQNYELQAVGLDGTKDGKPVDYSGEDYTENKIRAEMGEPKRTEY